MKKIIYTIMCLLICLIVTSCSIKTDDLEGATIYTTVYPINYLTNYLYKDYGTIKSIYPADCNLSEYKLTKKQIKEYAKTDLFVFNGLTEEKNIANDFLTQNKNLLIIDVSNGLTLENDPAELWLSPNNYLMLAKNIKNNLSEHLTSKYIIEDIEKKYSEFEEKISLMDASLHALGKESKENNKNTIVTSNNLFNYLNTYGFKTVSLQDTANLKENKLKAIKNNFKSGKYKYILVSDQDKENELIKEIVDTYKAKTIEVNTLTLTLTDDYFNIMTEYIENIKTIVS